MGWQDLTGAPLDSEPGATLAKGCAILTQDSATHHLLDTLRMAANGRQRSAKIET